MQNKLKHFCRRVTESPKIIDKNMKDDIPVVSIIIPCFNEEKYIAKCLDSVLAQDYLEGILEVLLIDGMSNDKTRSIITEYTNRYPLIKMLDNIKKIIPIALNIGIRASKGNIIIRLDAHVSYPPNYVSKCIRYLNEYKVDNVGGVLITSPSEKSFKADAIAFALSSPFGVGNSYFRIGADEPKIVDTVPFGCYRREVFEKIGLFNENLLRNEDIEFNLRLKKAGGRVLLVPDIKMFYYARGTYGKLLQNNFQNGFGVVYSIRFVHNAFSWRHLVPGACVIFSLVSLLLGFINAVFWVILISIFGLYCLTNLYFSFKQGKRWQATLYLIIAFFVLHFSYGLGSLMGIVKLLINKKQDKDNISS